MLRQNGKRGQVILETAIVLALAATVAISSMALFSNLNRNMVERLDNYRKSRTSVDDPFFFNALPPKAFLDFSPHFRIITEGGEGPGMDLPGDIDPGDYGDTEFVDPRLLQADLLLQQADLIINATLPIKVNQAYDLLGGDSCNDYWCMFHNVSYNEAEQARELCNEMLQDKANYGEYTDTELSAPRAYDDLYEDRGGTDDDGDGFLGAIGQLQQVLNDPTNNGTIEDNGPFDPDLGCPGDGSEEDQICQTRQAQNIANRNNLEETIESLKSTEVAVNQFLNELVIPRLTNVRNQLNSALEEWDDWQWGRWLRMRHLILAKNGLKEMLDFVGAIKDAVPSDDLAHQIQTAYHYLDVYFDPDFPTDDATNATESGNCCYYISINPEIIGEPPYDPNGEPPYQPILSDIINDAGTYLEGARAGWADPIIREHYLDLARQKLGVLHDIVKERCPYCGDSPPELTSCCGVP